MGRPQDQEADHDDGIPTDAQDIPVDSLADYVEVEDDE